MVFNRATIDDWRTKPRQVRLLDVFVGEDQIEIRQGKLVRTRYKNKGTPRAKPTTDLTWTPGEDALILGMKAHGKSFASISKAMKGKSEDAVIDRYCELVAQAPKKDEKKEEAKVVEEKKTEQETVKENTEENLEVATKEALKDIQETEKSKDADIKLDKEVQKINGKPVIYVDAGGKDDLSATEIAVLYIMNEHFEEKKWVAMSAKFFDKTGKRVSPNKLKEQLSTA
ncbi:hypothetical protein P7C71_g3610, partial [Lecanoromycetidae sp. Uapishka_2]